MTLLAVERIKLFSTRSPWWCSVLGVALVAGVAAIVATSADTVNIGLTQVGRSFGLVVVMVMAALSVTTEYRYGTIRATFQAVPNRSSALLAKTAVVAMLAAVVAAAGSFAAWGLATLIRPEADLALNSAADWRGVAGAALVFPVAAVLAVAVGLLVRHTAGAVTLLLVYSQIVEPVVGQLPGIGADIIQWMPFTMANMFLSGAPENPGVQRDGPPAPEAALSPWWALLYFAVFAAALLAAALITTRRRDA
ncbi:ABC-2 type transport system permease protein [Herbihabitans rhizosphaerae]|uniref:ABC-2 type transport system permease protein n=1 Tax=Herbihabitans rhizosphaerae TaxID=1872711 RepID=A0A4Q7KMY6_9PSEU|nr:hypothetical protein [Herbihabitans rhizosphaerae]RZS37714.1 ABC-2 type transport system permease protein [Herbihabitans rhizosphaerae]